MKTKKRARSKRALTAELVRDSVQHLRRMPMTTARAEALAPNVGRLNDAALDAARENDFNDEPASFLTVLARLKDSRE